MTEAENSAETGGSSRVLPWAIAVGIFVPLALVLVAASPLGENFFYVVFGIPSLLAVWAIAGLFALFVCLRSALRRQWRRCLAASILPIFLALVAANPTGFVRSFNTVGDVIHFVAMKPYYDRAVAALPADRCPRVAVFDWGGMSFASRGVVYDETDQVSLPPERRSAEWGEQASHSELACGGVGVRKLWDHYYLASFPC
jgi:hypothetical protein